jgi:hypothetical protein
MSATQPQSRPPKRTLRWLSLIALLFIVGATITLWLLFTTPPSWWATAGTLPSDAADRASALERGGSRALSEPRDSSEPWTISIAQQDANAWLAHRLKAWAENREIEVFTTDVGEIQPPRVQFEGGRVRVGVEVDGRVVGLAAIPIIVNDGLYLRQPRFFIGKVEFSTGLTARLAGLLAGRMGSTAAAEHRAFVRSMLEGTAPALESNAFRLDDGRMVRVVRVEVEGDRLLITCRTSPAVQ